MEQKQYNLQKICEAFDLPGQYSSARPHGEGHINDSFAVTYRMDRGEEYRILLQRINTHVFKNPAQLMQNIAGVTSHLRMKIEQRGGNKARETLTLLPTKDGALCVEQDGDCWRMYRFIEGTTSYQLIESPAHFESCGRAFGSFLCDLADYPVDTLFEVIPEFHNTAKRFDALQQAVEKDAMGRVQDAQSEIAFAMSHKQDAYFLCDLLERGALPLRVTHNDTKANNILVDTVTGEAVCIIDLDTVMPGLCLYDFGDSIRFGASTALEDERDLTKVSMDMSLFEAFTKGYLEKVKDRLTPEEIALLPIGAKTITLETGMRFLTDYLQGDTYFKISHPEHNLDRCRTQFALVADMEQKMDAMNAVVRGLCAKKTT